jgi:hypothetical protein
VCSVQSLSLSGSLKTILIPKHQTVSETYELIASENDLSVNTFVLIQQRKAGNEVELAVDDETRLFKERGLGLYLLCERVQQGQRTYTAPLPVHTPDSPPRAATSPTQGGGERRARRKGRGSIFLRKKKKDEQAGSEASPDSEFPSDFSELAALIRAEAEADAQASGSSGDVHTSTTGITTAPNPTSATSSSASRLKSSNGTS